MLGLVWSFAFITKACFAHSHLPAIIAESLTKNMTGDSGTVNNRTAYKHYATSGFTIVTPFLVYTLLRYCSKKNQEEAANKQLKCMADVD